jgi:hypothetical protein
VHQGLDGSIEHEVLLSDVLDPGARPSTDLSPTSFEVRHCDEGDCNDGAASSDEIVVSVLRTDNLGIDFEVVDTVSSLDREADNDHVTTIDSAKGGTLVLVTGVRIGVSDDGQTLVGDDGIVYYELHSTELSMAFVQRVPNSDLLYMLLADGEVKAYLYQALLEPSAPDGFRIVWLARARPQSDDGPWLDLPGGVSQLVDGRYAVMTEELRPGARPVMVDLQTGSVHALAVTAPLGQAAVAVQVVRGPVVRVATGGACAEIFAEPAESAPVVACVEAGTLLKLDSTSSPLADWIPVEIAGERGWIEKGSVR